jgi:cysteinyl-tRNA synthetase
MPIRLHDSLTRELRELTPSPDGIFRFYNCGPTVYAPAHIGNFRTFVINDVLRRLLELEFGPDKVKFVRNLTDVDDKTIKRARDEGRPLAEVTKQWTNKFHADCDALNILRRPTDVEPNATSHIREQVNMIEVLMEKGNAYRAPDGSVYFKVSSFENYGRLSRVKERVLQPGSALKAAAADADEKEDGSDFALWKAWKPDDGPNKWAGPHGAAEGRPGWHIECSAMSKAILGETIDLHTGGVDLLFPHHENEIAQSECCNGVQFSRHWYHSEHLLVDGKKMSKSLGNLYTLDDLIKKGNYSPEIGPRALRLALLHAHPRKQLNFSLGSLEAAIVQFRRISAFHQRLICEAHVSRIQVDQDISAKPFAAVLENLQEDLNLPGAIGALFEAMNQLEPLKFGRSQANKLQLEFSHEVLDVLGLKTKTYLYGQLSEEAMGWALDCWLKPQNTPAFGRLRDLGWWIDDIYKGGFSVREERAPTAPHAITALAEKRWAAKQAKDFATADALRKDLAAAGWAMLDGKDGYKLELLKK